MRRRRGSLRTQLIAWNILALALILGVLGVVIRYTVSGFLMASVNQELERQERRMPHFGRGGPGHGPDGHGPDDHGPNGGRMFPPGPPPGMFDAFPPGDPGAPPDKMPPWRDDDAYGPRHFDRTGTPLGPRQMLDRAGFDAVLRDGRSHYTTVTRDGEPVRVLSVPLYERSQLTGVGQAGYPVAEVYRALGVLDTALLTLTPVALLCAWAGGAYLTDRVLRRVRHTAEAAERISFADGARGELSARLPVTGDDEFSQLAETFNRLLGRLETAFQQQGRALEQQRRLTADASHELKTPLTVIRGTASLALSREAPTPDDYRRSLEEIDRAAGTMSDLVQDLLLLARSDAGQLGRERIEMLAREPVERALSGVVAAREHQVTLHVADESLTIRGNEGELIRLFTNLLDNAARYTPAPGTIAIDIAVLPGGGRIVYRITDSGVGIAPEHLPHLGERFYRVDAARARKDGGTGLGLSICRGIVEAHHGTLAFDSRPGAGTTVTVALPRYPA